MTVQALSETGDIHFRRQEHGFEVKSRHNKTAGNEGSRGLFDKYPSSDRDLFDKYSLSAMRP